MGVFTFLPFLFMAKMQNLKERIYNGAGHLGILDVPEEEVSSYEEAGFQRIDSPTDDSDEGDQKSLKEMNKKELLALATTLGVEGFTESTKNAELIALIEAKQADDSDEGDQK